MYDPLNELARSSEVSEKLLTLRTMVGEGDDATLLSYLALAAAKIVAKAYPFDDEPHDVPAKYGMLQVEIAAYLYNKRGAEGELSHTETGISRSYEAASVPDSMLKAVKPFCGVVS